jgi:hypothetical protein
MSPLLADLAHNEVSGCQQRESAREMKPNRVILYSAAFIVALAPCLTACSTSRSHANASPNAITLSPEDQAKRDREYKRRRENERHFDHSEPIPPYHPGPPSAPEIPPWSPKKDTQPKPPAPKLPEPTSTTR